MQWQLGSIWSYVIWRYRGSGLILVMVVVIPGFARGNSFCSVFGQPVTAVQEPKCAGLSIGQGAES